MNRPPALPGVTLTHRAQFLEVGPMTDSSDMTHRMFDFLSGDPEEILAYKESRRFALVERRRAEVSLLATAVFVHPRGRLHALARERSLDARAQRGLARCSRRCNRSPLSPPHRDSDDRWTCDSPLRRSTTHTACRQRFSPTGTRWWRRASVCSACGCTIVFGGADGLPEAS